MGKSLLINYLMPDKMLDKLAYGFDNIIRVEANAKLPLPVASHPDMQVLVIGDTVITVNELYAKSAELRQACEGKEVLFTEADLKDKYPSDVLLNACLVEKKLIARKDSLDMSVIHACQKHRVEIVNVKQGYAKCSTLVLGDKAIISADRTIVAASKMCGIDALLVSSGHIILDGYNYGFIGGASFYNADNNTVYFFGDIKYHPNCVKIRSFIEKYKVNIVCTEDCPLYDYGGAVVI
ncbi:MAG: hypothetical protein E7635_04905 [Ruminococcaceae bacterium]|nr:hypothetical protein [Oscillospiraceae bacterium]